MISIENMVLKLQAADARLKLNQERVERYTQELSGLEEYMALSERTHDFLTKLGKEAQEELREYIEDMVTLALQSVFGEDYEFVIELVSKRDQLEVSFQVRHKDNLLELKNDSLGGGIVDVCAFALRIVLWSLENPEAAPIILLDEPFRFVSDEYQTPVSNVLDDLSSMLKLQMIIITHNLGLMANREKTFEL
jgi:ABC-type dipeptide/oligopeptide/nickel transport system ATPase component